VAVNDSCQRCREWVSLELDIGLSEFERALMRRHLGACDRCAAFADGVRSTTQLLRSAEPAEPTLPFGLPARRRSLPLAVRAAPVAAGIVAALAAITATSLVGNAGHTPTGQQLSPAADLASMRLARRQQLLPAAAQRIRVIEID
jgi:predicted anti-sigma-YlaC factor YlaD